MRIGLVASALPGGLGPLGTASLDNMTYVYGVARTVTAPLMAIWADSFRLRRTALIFMAVIVAALYAAMALPLGFGGWLLVWFVASATFTTIPPLTDVLVLNRARRDGFNFGWPRGIGSAAFIVA